MLDILLIDDDELVRQTMSMLLEREGFRVTGAAGGREAIELGRGQLFDLVICDVRMGDMNGLETLAALRSSLPEAHMILITGYADESTPVEALRLRVDDYLRKPFDLDAFLARIRSLRASRRRVRGGQALWSFTEELRARGDWAEHVAGVERAVLGAAVRLGLPADEVAALRVAARLHDLVSGAPGDPGEVEDPVARLLVSLGGATDSRALQVLNAAVALAHGEAPTCDPEVLREVRLAGSDPAPVASTGLRFETLGDTRVTVDGRVCTFESARSRWLLVYLLSRRGQLVPQERLRDLFWPDSDGDRAQRALVSSVHRVRKALDRPDVLLREERGYRFNKALDAWWDVAEMERCLRAGQFAPGAQLYRGEFARDCADDWVLPLREACLRTAVSCWEGACAASSGAEAERYARGALELDRVSESAGAGLIRALAAQGRRDEAVRFYHAYVKTVERELALPPGPEVVRAYLEATAP